MRIKQCMTQKLNPSAYTPQQYNQQDHSEGGIALAPITEMDPSTYPEWLANQTIKTNVEYGSWISITTDFIASFEVGYSQCRRTRGKNSCNKSAGEQPFN